MCLFNCLYRNHLDTPRSNDLGSVSPITSVTPVTSVTSVTSVSHITYVSPITSVSPITTVSPIISVSPITSVSSITSVSPITTVMSVSPVSSNNSLTNSPTGIDKMIDYYNMMHYIPIRRKSSSCMSPVKKSVTQSSILRPIVPFDTYKQSLSATKIFTQYVNHVKNESL